MVENYSKTLFNIEKLGRKLFYKLMVLRPKHTWSPATNFLSAIILLQYTVSIVRKHMSKNRLHGLTVIMRNFGLYEF